VNAQIWTIPNALSVARLFGVPIFIWLIVSDRYLWGVTVLLIAGASDYFDGKIARKFNQMSRLGELLDPAADRFYIISVLISLYFLEIIPLWILILLTSRDIILAILLIVLKRAHIPPLPVTFLGKAATFNLLYAFPLLLLTKVEGDIGPISLSESAFILGWAFSIWGIALYLTTAADYLIKGITQLKVKK
jgi:cardiolipin synthase (CMP-forming)